MKFIFNLTDSQKRFLNKLFKHSDDYRVRLRAQAVLLSARSYTVAQIAEIFDVHRDTVARWLTEWESHGFRGLNPYSKKESRGNSNPKKVNLSIKIFESYNAIEVQDYFKRHSLSS